MNETSQSVPYGTGATSSERGLSRTVSPPPQMPPPLRCLIFKFLEQKMSSRNCFFPRVSPGVTLRVLGVTLFWPSLLLFLLSFFPTPSFSVRRPRLDILSLAAFPLLFSRPRCLALPGVTSRHQNTAIQP